MKFHNFVKVLCFVSFVVSIVLNIVFICSGAVRTAGVLVFIFTIAAYSVDNFALNNATFKKTKPVDIVMYIFAVLWIVSFMLTYILK